MKKRYWLRVGLAFFLAGMVLALFAMSESFISPDGHPGSWTYNQPPQSFYIYDYTDLIPGIQVVAPFIFFGYGGKVSFIFGIILFSLIFGILYGFVGVILGWLYGKIKNGNKHLKIVIPVMIFILFVCIFYFVYSNHFKKQENRYQKDIFQTFQINNQGEGAIQMGENGSKFIYRNGQWQPY